MRLALNLDISMQKTVASFVVPRELHTLETDALYTQWKKNEQQTKRDEEEECKKKIAN